MKKWIIMLACAALLTLMLPLTMTHAASLPDAQVPRHSATNKPDFAPREPAEWKNQLQDEWQALQQIHTEQKTLQAELSRKMQELKPLLKAVVQNKDKDKALELISLQVELQNLREAGQDFRHDKQELRTKMKQARESKNVSEMEAALKQMIKQAQTQTSNLKQALKIVAKMESILK